MDRNGGQFAVTLSVLDRLIDEEPGMLDRVQVSRAESVRALKSSVRRDLEWLLNTRRTAVPPPDSLRELSRSAYVFGLPDFSAYSLASAPDRARLMRDLHWAEKTFEPRLDQVHIVPVEDDPLSHALHFRIDGLLVMDPAPERVTFDTVLELTSGQYQVKGDANAG
jgi:type VI secretion system protein ImpF